MGTSTTARNQALDGLITPTNVLAYVALNTNDPGTTGANEYTTTRQGTITWNAAAAGQKTNSTAMTIPTLGASACTHFSTWSASSGGTFGISGALGSSVTATNITIASGAITLSAT